MERQPHTKKRRIADAEEMVDACFEKPESEEQGREYSMGEIVELVSVRFPNVKCTMALKLKLGSALRKRGFVTRHRKTGNFYVVMPKLAA